MSNKISSNKNSDKPHYPGNSIMVRPDGPLICKGDTAITIESDNAEVIFKGDEFALCRCGLSGKKPFCDGTHKKEGVTASQSFSDEREQDIIGLTGDLTITLKTNAMYSIKGPVTLFSRDGLSKTTRTKAALCRCGQSQNKPFCDFSHKKSGFIA